MVVAKVKVKHPFSMTFELFHTSLPRLIIEYIAFGCICSRSRRLFVLCAWQDTAHDVLVFQILVTVPRRTFACHR